MRTSSDPLLTLRQDQTARRSIEITVLHTNADATAQALDAAARLTKGLTADIRVLVLQVVPYPLPLETPDVPIDFTQQRVLEMVSRVNVEVRVEIQVGRDKGIMLESALKPNSVVVIGGRQAWWPTPESSVARMLKRLGHQVISMGSD